MTFPHVPRLLTFARVHPAWWVPISLLVLAVDFSLGLSSWYTAAFLVPVTIAAWYSGQVPGFVLAAALPLSHLALVIRFTNGHPSHSAALLNAGLCIGVYLVVACGAARLAEYERLLRRHLRALEGMLPICAGCKSIRDPNGEWQPLEDFIERRSSATFSHGLCPRCVSEYYDDLPGQALEAEMKGA